MRGGERCRAHRDRSEGHGDESVTLEQANARRLRAETFAALVRAGRHEELVEATLQHVMTRLASEQSLLPEIGALRLQLRQVIAVDALDGDTQAVTAQMTRLVDGIVRAMRMQHTLSGDLAETVSSAFTIVLSEMGLGAER
jgi:hypothetical protein